LVGTILGGLTVAAMIGVATEPVVVAAALARAVLLAHTRRRDCAPPARKARGDG
jgi:hypothetical protein